ncbi:MAG: glucosyltransferase domain-containing protein [Bacteroidales bacterium]|jgi:hypothetical protein|nr:glucosyltransferase domain-containing protein [Bacteroidales bacterium]
MKFFKTIKEDFLSLDINKKELGRSVLFLTIVYALACISIFRANYSYMDDVQRAIEGHDMAGTFSRYISKHLSWFIHTADYPLTDISPVTQLIACVILAFTGYIVVQVIAQKSTKYLLLATLPIGLSPYFLECISYKFDAPYMALSILASVFPFVYMHCKPWFFALISVLSLLIMIMTYQAASGIFIMLTLFFFFRTILTKSDSVANAFKFLGIAIASYVIALLLFRFCFMKEVVSYVSTDITVNQNIASLFWHNICRYFSLMYKEWNILWKIVTAVIVVVWFVKTIVFSKRNKVVAFGITTLFLALLAASIFGLYLFFENPLVNPRAMYGVGIFLAIIAVDMCASLKKYISFPVMLLSWCFIVFAFAYGNCLADQKRYDEFHLQMLAHDISKLVPEKSETHYEIAIIGNIARSPVVKNVAYNNPVINRLVPTLQGGHPFTPFMLLRYYNLPFRWNRNLVEQEAEMPVVFDSFYHTIKKSDKAIVVILK